MDAETIFHSFSQIKQKIEAASESRGHGREAHFFT